MNPPVWLSATEALALLRVRPQTLYASVSRRRIRVKKDPDDPRRRLYHAADVQRLAARSRGRPSRERVAAEAVSWGSPVLESGISTVAQGRLWYRGQDAVRLAAHATLEEVAALLWQSGPVVFTVPAEDLCASRGLSARQAIYLALAHRAGVDPPMQGRALAVLQAEGAVMMGVLAEAVLGAILSGPPERRRTSSAVAGSSAVMPLHQRLAQAWRRPRAEDLIRRTLVLLADHELNASTFATRVAASTGACLPACLLAGFSTLSGPSHGMAASRMQALADTAVRVGALPAIRGTLERGERITAFGHPLYPEGDVRAQDMMGVMTLPPLFQELHGAGVQLLGEPPNVDFALAALADAQRLPADAPLVLFALARATGWIAHALEQHQHGSLIRPRARYTGPAPAGPAHTA